MKPLCGGKPLRDLDLLALDPDAKFKGLQESWAYRLFNPPELAPSEALLRASTTLCDAAYRQPIKARVASLLAGSGEHFAKAFELLWWIVRAVVPAVLQTLIRLINRLVLRTSERRT